MANLVTACFRCNNGKSTDPVCPPELERLERKSVEMWEAVWAYRLRVSTMLRGNHPVRFGARAIYEATEELHRQVGDHPFQGRS